MFLRFFGTDDSLISGFRVFLVDPACKPYLIFAIEECVRCAQRGGVGVVVYFRKEGRALGEVTKSVSLLLGATFSICSDLH
jgi:hypothetical protein